MFEHILHKMDSFYVQFEQFENILPSQFCINSVSNGK